MKSGRVVPAVNMSIVSQYLMGSYLRRKIPVFVSVKPSRRLATSATENPVAISSGIRLSAADLDEK